MDIKEATKNVTPISLYLALRLGGVPAEAITLTKDNDGHLQVDVPGGHEACDPKYLELIEARADSLADSIAQTLTTIQLQTQEYPEVALRHSGSKGDYVLSFQLPPTVDHPMLNEPGDIQFRLEQMIKPAIDVKNVPCEVKELTNDKICLEFDIDPRLLRLGRGTFRPSDLHAKKQPWGEGLC